MRLIIYLSYGLFLDKYEKLWIQACDQLKPITGQRITLKNSHLNEVYISARCSHVTLVSRYPFHHLSIDHKMDVHHQVKDRWYTVFALDKQLVMPGHYNKILPVYQPSRVPVLLQPFNKISSFFIPCRWNSYVTIYRNNISDRKGSKRGLHCNRRRL